MVGWHHQLNGHEFEQALGVGDGQGSLVCCSPWGCKESDMTEWLNWTKSALTRKFISLIASIGKERNFQINDVCFYLNKPEKRQIKSQKCKGNNNNNNNNNNVKEIIKINIEVNEIKTKAIEKSMKPKLATWKYQ